MERRLAAILAADVVGYSHLMEQDEASTLAALRDRRKSILAPLVALHKGRIIKFMGDGVLVEFPSAVNAVQCAIELQQKMADANTGVEDDRAIILRIGINLGDVAVEGGDLYGDGVNIAARLEGIAEPGAVCVSRTIYDQIKGKLQLECRDIGPQQLKNISEPVQAFCIRPQSGEPKRHLQHGASPYISPKPTVAVLPFVNLNGDPDQEWFSDGLTEDVINALSRVSGILVIARASTMSYKAQTRDIRRIAKELGVEYIMEGSVRRGGERLRITTQLVDARSGHQIWAERYDRPAADLFDIQDEIARSTASSLETHLSIYLSIAERSFSDTHKSATLKAKELVTKSVVLLDEARDFEEPSELVEEALRIDPSYPRAHIVRAHVLLHRLALHDLPRSQENIERVLELAKVALRFARGDEYAHQAMAWAYAVAGRIEEAVAECERALDINPNASVMLGDLGHYLAILGKPEQAIEKCRLAMRLNPRDPTIFWRQATLAIAHFVAGEYEAAVQEARSVTHRRPDFIRGPLTWAAAAMALGHTEEAETALRMALEHKPDLSARTIMPDVIQRFARQDDTDRFLGFLQTAGLPP